MDQKTDMQAVLQACVDALLHDGVPTDPEHPKRIALNAAESALASRPDAQADERGAFEAWVKSEYGYSTERYELGGYKRPELNMWWTTWQARAAAPQAEAAPEPKQIKAPDIILTGAQLLEALDFIAPDRDSDQLESEAAFAYGEGHSGKAMYVWCADYPEEGSFVCDGSSAAASPKAEAAQGVPEGWKLVPIKPTAEMLMLVYDPGAEETPSERYKKLLSLAATPAPVSDPADMPEGWRELCRRLYVELFHCDQQMRSTLNQDGEPHWTQSAVVRDVLKDAKTALAAAPAPASESEQLPAENAAVRNKIAAALHYPEHWDDTAYPTLDHAAWEAIATSKMACSECAEQPIERGERQSFPERDATKTNAEQGLYRKFEVRRVDGSDALGGKHHGCEYFVLDMTHDQHAPAALRAYAQSCASTHPQMSADLAARFGGERQGAAAVVREALEAAFEERDGWRVKVAGAVRTIGAASASTKAEAKCKACNGNDGDMPCAYPEGRADCLHNASAPTLGGGDEVVSPAELRSHARTIRMKEDNQGSIDRDCAEAAEALEWAALIIEAYKPQPQEAEPKGLTLSEVSDTLLVDLFYAAQGNITEFRRKARALLSKREKRK